MLWLLSKSWHFDNRQSWHGNLRKLVSIIKILLSVDIDAVVLTKRSGTVMFSYEWRVSLISVRTAILSSILPTQRNFVALVQTISVMVSMTVSVSALL